ncbi:MAG: VWA domain-containing protein [Spirochaetales bacterium]|nr:VWA domain-containing protein [Spirochaetales bacterium]
MNTGGSVNIENPLGLLFLFILVPVVYAALRNYLGGKVFRSRLAGNPEGQEDEEFGGFFVRTFLSTFFFCLFLVFSILALADISWGTAPETEDRNGLDVVVVLDVSYSMLAQDSSPSRLEAACDIALGLIQGLGNSRFAVTAFKGGAVLAVPMTEDREILEAFFLNANPSVVNTPGTSVESGLETALGAFPAGTASHRAVVLLSDGESLSDFTGRAVEKASALGIPVFAVGLGGTQGSVIRLPDGKLLTDYEGRPVVTRQNVEALEAIAGISGGEYFSFREPGLISLLMRKLGDFEESRGKMGFRLVAVHRYRSFLLVGFLFLCASILIRSVKWKKK